MDGTANPIGCTAAVGCDLCGLPVGPRPFPLRTARRELQFCCASCRGVYELLNEPWGAKAAPAPPGPAEGTRH